MDFSIGIGITNKCNFNCSHCYSREEKSYDLDFRQIKDLCESLNISSINFGTGESGLHEDFSKIIEYVRQRGIKTALTTNGYTVSLINDGCLSGFNDIDFSVDFANRDMHDGFRGAGAYSSVQKGVERCKRLGVEVSFACAMMKDNYMMMDKMVALARDFNVNLRVNIYKPVHTEKHLLTYDEFWEGIRRLFASSKIVSCSEPIVNAVLKNKTLDGGSRCGKKSLRIRPDAGIVPCVYWNTRTSSIDELVKYKTEMSPAEFDEYIEDITYETKIIPRECECCDSLDICQGGCAARRLYNNMDKPDPYCFKLYGKEVPELKYEWGDSKDLVHSSYLCTIIVQ